MRRTIILRTLAALLILHGHEVRDSAAATAHVPAPNGNRSSLYGGGPGEVLDSGELRQAAPIPDLAGPRTCV